MRISVKKENQQGRKPLGGPACIQQTESEASIHFQEVRLLPGGVLMQWEHTEYAFLRPVSTRDHRAAEMEKNSQCSLEIAEGLGLRWSTSYDACLLVPIYVNFVFACESRHVRAKVHIWKLGTTLGVVPRHQR